MARGGARSDEASPSDAAEPARESTSPDAARNEAADDGELVAQASLARRHDERDDEDVQALLARAA